MNTDLLKSLDELILSLNTEDINLIINNKSVIERLDEVFSDIDLTIDLDFIKGLKLSKLTLKVIKKYLVINNIKMREDTATNFNLFHEFIKDISDIPVLSYEKQNELLKKYQKLKEKSDLYIKKIIGQYCDVMDDISKNTNIKSYSIKDEETKYKIKYSYQIRLLIKLLEEQKINNYDKDYVKKILNHSVSNHFFTSDKIVLDIDEYNNFKVLNKNEFDLLIHDFQENEKKRKELRKKIAEHNLKLVISIAKKYQNYGLELSDLVQEGILGLLKGIDKYRLEEGTCLSTYATSWITQSILRAICDKSKTIRIPNHINDRINKYNKFINKYFNEHGCYPSNEEIAEELNISVKAVMEINNYNQEISSLNDFIKNSDGDEGDELLDFVEDKKTNVESEVLNSNLKNEILNLLDELPPREKTILLMRYGIMISKPFVYLYSDKDGHNEKIIVLTSESVKENEIVDYLINNNETQYISYIYNNYEVKICHLNGKEYILEDIGAFFDLTRERVRQIEIKTLLKLKKPEYENLLSN